jgi:nucleoside-diphosphate-sugar epimerase
MRVFVTGATGFIGTALVPELIAAGHQVLGMTRSDEGAAALAKAGAEVHYGTLEDLDGIQSGAAKSDGVIHLAFNHDFSKFAENSETDRRVIEALGATLKGSDRPLIITSGTAAARGEPGRILTEEDPPNSPLPRVASEQAAERLAKAGVRVASMRLPQVHNPIKQGLITQFVAIARQKGVSAYVGDGRNRWAAGHLSDVARLYVLALENAKAGARYNAVGEEGVAMREIAESLGRGLKLPTVSITQEQAAEHFGWLGMLVSHDMAASSALTQKWLGWKPTGPSLISDLDKAAF